VNSDIYRLFVYGSLRSGLHNAIFTYISSYFVLEGMGAVQGKLYDLGEYPGAIPDTGKSHIIGEVYRIEEEEDFEWAMEQIDDYEGYVVSEGATSLFRRELATVSFQDTTIVAWMYWYNRPVGNATRILSGDFVAYKMGLGK
jgi:gamma-glutamylcyclotransferase (GGCT)/AIG2-like uncharacterized protein YtfP